MQFETTVVKIRQQTPTVKSFVLDCGKTRFDFHAGQWVDIHRTIDDKTHNCGYSITSIPSKDNAIEIAAKLAPELLLTKYLHEDCKVGDKLFVSKAQGDIWIDKGTDAPCVFIAGGVGITPLYSMIKQLTQSKPRAHIVLLYSITSPEEFLFEENINQLKTLNPNFRTYVTVTRSRDHQLDFNGRISKDLLESINLPHNAFYYLCGPPPMVDAVVEMLAELKSVLQLKPENILYDKWWA